MTETAAGGGAGKGRGRLGHKITIIEIFYELLLSDTEWSLDH